MEWACRTAGCNEFIKSKDMAIYDERPASLLDVMEDNKDTIMQYVPKEEYDGEMKILKVLAEQKAQRGEFRPNGYIDDRPEELKDVVLDDGFDLICGTRGGKLSLAQQQRLSIARSIVKQPGILVLDDAASALDEAAQKSIYASLESSEVARTRVILAESADHLEKCDQVYVLDDGRIAEAGTFQPVLLSGQDLRIERSTEEP